MKGIERSPMVDLFRPQVGMPPTARGVVFDTQQANELFSPVRSYEGQQILCVDGHVCKWVSSLHEARDFFKPSTKFVCSECGYIMVEPRKDGDDIEACYKCGDGDVDRIENLGEIRAHLAQILAGSNDKA